jgi:hypothetical protein
MIKMNNYLNIKNFKIIKDKFYVYVYFDTRYKKEYIYEDLSFDYKPIYIGKGKNERFLDHIIYINKLCKKNTYFFNTLRKIKESNVDDLVKIIKYFDNEVEAFEYEKKLIDTIGRKIINSKNPLLNISIGGIGVVSSSVPEEIRKKLYGSKGKKNPAYRKDIDLKLNLIIEDYVNNKLTLKDLSEKYKADKRIIKKRLLENNIDVNRKNQYLKSSKNMKLNNPSKNKKEKICL